MTYQRVIHRNGVTGDYGSPADDRVQALKSIIAGDLRRLERDQRDERHVAAYAAVAGITPEQAKAVLDAFFDGLDPSIVWPEVSLEVVP